MTGRYRRKTRRQTWNQEDMDEAITAVKAKKMGWLKAAKTYNVPQATLRRRATNKNQRATGSKKLLGRFYATFDEKTERDLVSHIKLLESRLFGLTTREVRQLAFQFAEKNKINHRFNQENKIAGKEWLRGFLKRNRDISLRQPEATSAARAMAFNKPNVARFFEILSTTIQSESIDPERIYNMDESGLSTVQKPPRVLAATGKKQVGALTSAERGLHVTAVCCMNAVGNFVPPALIFPRKNKKDELLDKAPPCTLGLYQESGWMTTDLFVKWLQHFAHHAKPSTGRKVLLLLDGHVTHKSLEAVTFARENGIILCCFPAHCTHRLQLLDVTFFGPLKVFYNQECANWLKIHPGRVITAYQISELFAEAYGKSATVQNAISGFMNTGISPLKPNIFPEHLFLPADTTDRIEETDDDIENMRLEETDLIKIIEEKGKSERKQSSQKTVTFEEISPLPNAPTKRRKNNTNRYPLLTCSPNLIDLREKAEKKRIKEEKQKNKVENVSVVKRRVFSTRASTSGQTNLPTNYYESDEEEPDPYRTVEDDDDVACLYCNDIYSNSRSKETWVKCMICSNWAHVMCAGLSPKDKTYVCELCS